LDDRPKVDAVVVQQEPEEVIEPIAAYQLDQNNMIRMSKPVFALLMFLLAGFMGYTAYSLFNKPTTQKAVILSPTIDSASIADSIATVQKANALYREKNRITDSIVKATARQELERAKKQNQYEPDTTLVDTVDKEPNN
jgi:hypothetical protein